ncbi:uncharacterized protein LOC120931538 [Rana temporaria]|uniref:uncharacterized protein LOC120931538 n=1 Tax=Rana temporaria TaxID=8407 RepID=UPI001AAD2D18|nr:uncharacterized protein LOC120931538 [Rana temporaria]
MDPAEVKWSAFEYTLQAYVTDFQKSFPNIIKITEGFLGKQEIDSISSSTVIRVHSLYNQRRVTAETRTGKLFSLPVKLKRLKFLVPSVKGPIGTLKHQNPMNLEDILAKYTLPVTIRTSKVLSYKQKGDMKSQDEMLSELMLQDTYEEMFLFGHPIDKGKFFVEEPIVIPMYMKELRLAVAMGYKDGNTDKWNSLCGLLTQQVNNQGNTANATFEEIVLLDKRDVNPQEPSYSTIEPIYIDLNEINSDYKAPLDNKRSSNVYQFSLVSELKQVQQTQNKVMPKSPSVNTPNTIDDIPNDLYNLTLNTVKPESPTAQPFKPILDVPKNLYNFTPNTVRPESPTVQPLKPIHGPKDLYNLTPKTVKPESPTVQSFRSIHDVPKDLRTLTVKQVCECLIFLNMNQYIQAFEASQVDGHLVYDLNQEMMKSCLGMNGLNCVKFLKFRDGWRPNLDG